MLGERFVVQDCLGGNDRAALYRARDNASGGELRVVQVLRRDAIGDGVAIRRFVAERAALLTLLHDNLVTIEDIAVDSATVTIVSEHVVGPDLGRLRHEYGGTLPPALAVDVARQVLLGLSALHAIGLVHTDVRPGSVLVPRVVEPAEARLAGAALGRIGRGGQGRLDRLPRPVAFTAPEVLLGGRPTAASDVYAVGVLLYEALTGRTPFAGTSDLIAGGEIELAPPRPPDVPDELWAILAMMLTKDPAGRPSSAVSVADGLGAIAPDFTLLGPAAPMANPDPWSLRPAVAPAQRRSVAALPTIPAASLPAAAAQVSAAAASGPPPLAVPAGPGAVAAGAGTLTPRRRVLVSAGAASVVALGALAGVVTVAGEHKPHDVAATLPFADESYSTGAVVVSRTWSLSPAGDRLHGEVAVRRTAAGGPADVPEWLPSQLSDDHVSASHGVRKQMEAGTSVLQLSAPKAIGRTVTYTYDVDTHGGPATVARLQGWAVNQAVQAAQLRADLGQPQPDTVAALSVNTPAVALPSQGARYSLALTGGDNLGQVADGAALGRTSYASDDPSVAAVDAHGVVRSRHPGTTVVTARLGPLAASATVLVTDPKKAVPLQFVRTHDGQVVVDAKPTAPAQPAKVTAHAGNGTALVIWSRPDDGGQPITSYDVYADGRKVATTTGDTYTTVRNLDRDRSYRFTVVARNRLGHSGPSPASKPILPRGTSTDPSGCVPTAPTQLTASLVGRTTVRVTWQAPPAQKGCAVSAVRIQSFPPSRTVAAAPGATSVDIPGLDTATQYDFAVTAAFGQDPPQTSTRSTPVQTNYAPCWDGSYSDPCPARSGGDQTVAAPISKLPPPVAVTVEPVVGPRPTPVEPPSSPVPASSAPGVIPPTTTAPIETSPAPTASQPPLVDTPTASPPQAEPTTPPTTAEPAPTTPELPPPDESSDSPPPPESSSPADATSTPTDTPSS